MNPNLSPQYADTLWFDYAQYLFERSGIGYEVKNKLNRRLTRQKNVCWCGKEIKPSHKPKMSLPELMSETYQKQYNQIVGMGRMR